MMQSKSQSAITDNKTMRTFSFENRKIGAGEPCFITFEAGPTHNSLASAKELVSLASKTGADAVKFQVFDPDRLVADKKQLFDYEILVDRETGKTEKVSEPLYDILCRRCLTHSEWRELKAHADSLSLAFFATAAFDEDIALLESIKCDSIKIASADIDHLPLIRKVARTGMCVQIDTGNATMGEVEAAVDAIAEEGNERVIIHHCPSGYPAHLPSINLNVIPTLLRMFHLPVAFSDHTPGRDMDIAAIALGANMVEKTITMDRMTPSVEHVFSLEPDEMEEFVTAIRELEIALGDTRRHMSAQEREKNRAIRRSAFLQSDVKSGQILKVDDIEFRRPGHGVSPVMADEMIGKTLRNDVKAGDMLKPDDVVW